MFATMAGRTDIAAPIRAASVTDTRFCGTEMLRDRLVRAVADAPASATAIDAAGAAFEAAGAVLQENPERVRLRDTIVSAHAELRERELIKLAALAAAVAGALRDRGIAEPAASLAAETGVAVFKVAFARWVSAPGQPDLPDLPGIFRESMAELRGALALCSIPTPTSAGSAWTRRMSRPGRRSTGRMRRRSRSRTSTPTAASRSRWSRPIWSASSWPAGGAGIASSTTCSWRRRWSIWAWSFRVVQDGDELVLQTLGPEGWAGVYSFLPLPSFRVDSASGRTAGSSP